MRTRVKELRKQRNISQMTLATWVGCSQNTISKIEKGDCDPKVSLIMEIAAYFGVSVDYVLGESKYRYKAESDLKRANLSVTCVNYLNKIEKLTPEHRELIDLMIDKLALEGK
jgi:DNA-binding XRE family transcriptional regulator